MQRRRATSAGAGARGYGLPHPPVSRSSPARDESSFGCVADELLDFGLSKTSKILLRTGQFDTPHLGTTSGRAHDVNRPADESTELHIRGIKKAH